MPSGPRLRTAHKYGQASFGTRHGFPNFEQIGCSQLLSLQEPGRIVGAISALLEAGADGISTNTFGATPSLLSQNGVASAVATELAFEANLQSVRLARRLAEKEYSSSKIMRRVLSSMGPTYQCLNLMRADQSVIHQVGEESYHQARACGKGALMYCIWGRFALPKQDWSGFKLSLDLVYRW